MRFFQIATSSSDSSKSQGWDGRRDKRGAHTGRGELISRENFPRGMLRNYKLNDCAFLSNVKWLARDSSRFLFAVTQTVFTRLIARFKERSML